MKAVKLEGALVTMLKSYRWIVAIVFVFALLFMVREPFSIGAFVSKDASPQNLGIEEREVILQALSRLENQKSYQLEVEKLNDFIKKETVPILVLDLNERARIKFSEGVGLLFSKEFFSADPISQELYLKTFFEDFAKNEGFYQGSLAKLPTKSNYSSKSAKYK